MAIPGIRGTDHIGFTVPDLEEAERFLVDVLGAERFYSLGPYQNDGDWMKTNLDVHPRTTIPELRFYRLGNGANFEVFQYDSADGQNPEPRNSDIGGHHIAFYVDDFDAALAYLKEQGVETLGEPTKSSGMHEGQTWIYFKAPWGMYFELVSSPNGKAYEKVMTKRLWHPARPTE